MALLPFYLPKRICDLFFRLKRYFSEKNFVKRQSIFRFYKEAILLWLKFLQIFRALTGKV